MLQGQLTLRRRSDAGPGHSFRAILSCGKHVVCIPKLISGSEVPFQIRVDPDSCGDKLILIVYERDRDHPLAAVAGYAFFTLAGDLKSTPVVVGMPRTGQQLLGSSVRVMAAADEKDVWTADASIRDIQWTAGHPDLTHVYKKLDASVEKMSRFMQTFDPYEATDATYRPLREYNGLPIVEPQLVKAGRMNIFEVPGALVDGSRANFPIAFYFEPTQDGDTEDDYLRHLLVLASSRYACEAALVTEEDFGTFLSPKQIASLPAALLARIYGMAVALPSCSRQYNSDHILTGRTETDIENFGSPVNSGTDDCDGFAWLSAWTHREFLLRTSSACPLLRRIATEIALQYAEMPVLTTSTSASASHKITRASEHAAVHLVLVLVRRDILSSWTDALSEKDESSPLPGVLFCEGTANYEPWWRMADSLAPGDYELHRREWCENLYQLATNSGIAGFRRFADAHVVRPEPLQFEHPFYRVGILALVPTARGRTRYTEHIFVTDGHHGAVLESIEKNSHHVTLVPTQTPPPEIMGMAEAASCLIPRSLVPRAREDITMRTSPVSVKGRVCVPFFFPLGLDDASIFHRLAQPFVHFTENADSETRQDVVLVYPTIE